MNTYFFVLPALFMVTPFLAGQVKVELPSGDQRLELDVEAGRIEGHVSLSHFVAETVLTDTGTFLKLAFPGGYPAGKPGAPDLPVLSMLAEANANNDYSLSILTLDSTVFDLRSAFGAEGIIPAHAPVPKAGATVRNTGLPEGATDPPPADAASDGTAFPVAGLPVRLEQQGFMRGIPLSTVLVAPFRYDPDNFTLIVYHNLRFVFSPGEAAPVTAPLRSAVFSRAMNRIVRDSQPSARKRLVSQEPLTMVVLADPIFRDTLQPLINWKTMKGFRVIEAYTDDPAVGSTREAIRDFMSGIYHNPPEGYAPPSYLLIVGDVEHIPLSQSSGQVTDLYYTTFDGPGDYLPELFHGRISVKNSSELAAVIDKILVYEQYAFPDPSFLDRTVLIAGYDVSYASLHGNGQINYAADNYFNSSNGIDARVYLHPSAATQDEQIRQEISAGAALVNYTGHGEYYGWLDPSFRLVHADTMTNVHKYGLMIGNGCSTNDFDLPGTDCFAELLVKLPQRGAVGYIGCTNDSYWDEDFYWSVGVGAVSSHPDYASTGIGFYDKLFHQGDEPEATWAPSMGEMIFAGNMAVQQSTSRYKKYYWEIYQLMGDPTLVPWFSQAADNPVVYPAQLPPDAVSLGISADAYDYIALSVHGDLITAAHAGPHGQAYLTVPDSLANSDLLMVVTGDRRRPLIDTIRRASSRRGYLELAGYGLKAESVSADGQVSAGEQFSLDLLLVNKGDYTFHASDLLIGCRDDFIEVIDSVAGSASIAPGDTFLLEEAFLLGADPRAADGAAFTLSLEKWPSTFPNNMYFTEMVHAPVLTSAGITWEDRTYGNGNGKIERGERLLFNWRIRNTGTYRSDSLEIAADPGHDLVMQTGSSVYGPLIPGETGDLSFFADISSEAPVAAPMQFPLTAGDVHSMISDSMLLVIGRHFEDFSTGNLERFNWGVTEKGWKADSLTYSGAPFALRSGSISHNQRSAVFVEVEVAAPDSVMFDLKVSSEANYDYLKFFVDSVLIEQWSGNRDWQTFTLHLDTGRYMLEWRYQKDVNTSTGEDAAWIDNVIFPAYAYDSIDLGILKLMTPTDSKSLGSREELKILVGNTGRDVIQGFTAGYRIDSAGWNEYFFDETLLPGQQLEVVFPDPADLSALADYTVQAGIRANGDRYPGNDTLTFIIRHYVFPDLSLLSYRADSAALPDLGIVVDVENAGNREFEQWHYAVYLDGVFVRADSLLVLLEPGMTAGLPVLLADADTTALDPGWHTFTLLSGPDSLAANNTLEGSVFWQVQSREEYEGEAFRIYPNPVSKAFFIQAPAGTALPVRVELYTLNGRKIHETFMRTPVHVIGAPEISGEQRMCVVRLTDGSGNPLGEGMILLKR